MSSVKKSLRFDKDEGNSNRIVAFNIIILSYQYDLNND